MSKCVVIYSGGMDSTVILHHCIEEFDEVYCLTYNYNQRHKREIDRALDYTTDLGVGEGQKIKQHIIVDLSFYSKLASASALTNSSINVPKMKDVIGDPQNLSYVPNRNMVMLSIAAGYAESVGANHIVYGAAQADNMSGFWDCTNEFLDTINSCLALNRRNGISVIAPLINMSKMQIINYGNKLGVKFDRTWTCYNGMEKSCGECPACSARIKGFIDANLIDPLPYSRVIDWQKYNCKPI